MINLEHKIIKQLSPEMKAFVHQTYLLDLDVAEDMIITKCCKYNLFKTSDNEWIEYIPKQKIKRISHGYSPLAYKEAMDEIEKIRDVRLKDEAQTIQNK